jgi:hypothetical protein
MGAGSGTHRNVTENGQEDVDEEISIAAALEEDTQRREDDGKKDLADVAGGVLAGVSFLTMRLVASCTYLAVKGMVESCCGW